MTISIWRLSHLMLALLSSIFIILASVTGGVLAFEPISNQLLPYKVNNNVSIAKTIYGLSKNYNEIITIETDINDFVIASVITKEGNSETFYVNPETGKKIGDLIEKAPVFKFATNLHRSLFLKSTGRFLVGLFSLLLFIIAITGFKLILKHQGGFKRFFSKVIKENFEQYYHVIIGRYALIPIIIITITGVFLSLEKFDVLPSDKMNHEIFKINSDFREIQIQEFEIFKSTKLNQLKSIEFPFSDDDEDYFVLELNNKELYINQYSGEIISKGEKPLIALASNWSMILHTGQGTFVWSVVLLLTCFTILFFMYSGFAMTIKRKKETAKINNVYRKDEANYIILIGSETGSTFRFAKLFFDALLKQKQTVFMSELNRYTNYKKVTHLIVFTSTYGEGEAPENAKNFEVLLEKINQTNPIRYSVLGFGSLMYPDFCKYAIVVDALLQKHNSFIPNLPLIKINNQSFETFDTWISQWCKTTQFTLKVEQPKPKVNRKKLNDFEVIETTELNNDNTCLIQLKPNKKAKFQSGDLLAFYPEEDHVERLYSVGRVDEFILLSIKKHDFGVCSNQLCALIEKDITKAIIKRNEDFHFPSNVKEVVMIANGTGIAPFLGMINENINEVKTHLFWGGRTRHSLKIYSDVIDTAFNKRTLSSFHIAYSQEQEERIYVQDLIEENAIFFAKILKNHGVVMICGSVAMQNRVLEVLNTITITKLKQPLSVFKNNGQIKTDCY